MTAIDSHSDILPILLFLTISLFHHWHLSRTRDRNIIGLLSNILLNEQPAVYTLFSVMWHQPFCLLSFWFKHPVFYYRPFPPLLGLTPSPVWKGSYVLTGFMCVPVVWRSDSIYTQIFYLYMLANRIRSSGQLTGYVSDLLLLFLYCSVQLDPYHPRHIFLIMYVNDLFNILVHNVFTLDEDGILTSKFPSLFLMEARVTHSGLCIIIWTLEDNFISFVLKKCTRL